MITSNLRATVALAAFLSAVSFPSLSSGEEQSLEEVARVVVGLLESVESEFDCIIEIVSIEEIPAYQSVGKFYATFRAAGSRCAEASDMLLVRGKAEGFIFFRRDESRSQDKRGQKPILDLIHEIDPPIEN